MTAEVHGVLTHFLTGHWHTSTASADPMGLIDMARYDWSDELLAAVGLTRDQLPKLFRPGDIMGEVTAAGRQGHGPEARHTSHRRRRRRAMRRHRRQHLRQGPRLCELGTACVSGSYGKPYAHDRRSAP